eukprot:292430-Chlamydomonas_euryale.AAC.2
MQGHPRNAPSPPLPSPARPASSKLPSVHTCPPHLLPFPPPPVLAAGIPGGEGKQLPRSHGQRKAVTRQLAKCDVYIRAD